MEIDLSWLYAEGINVEEGIGFTGGKEKYLSALQRYLKSYEKNKTAVEELLSSGDTEGYMIKVHALRSNSRMIGAAALAEAFEALEHAAKSGDTAFIGGKTGEVLQKYAEIIEMIKPAGAMEEVHAPDELSAEKAEETAGRLLEALEDFDDDLSAELAKKLKGYPFRPAQKEKLDEAIRYINDFLYDEASELIREIRPSIED